MITTAITKDADDAETIESTKLYGAIIPIDATFAKKNIPFKLERLTQQPSP